MLVVGKPDAKRVIEVRNELIQDEFGVVDDARQVKLSVYRRYVRKVFVRREGVHGVCIKLVHVTDKFSVIILAVHGFPRNDGRL